MSVEQPAAGAVGSDMSKPEHPDLPSPLIYGDPPSGLAATVSESEAWHRFMKTKPVSKVVSDAVTIMARLTAEESEEQPVAPEVDPE